MSAPSRVRWRRKGKTVSRSTEWMDAAACRASDVEFVDVDASDPSEALTICATCPVQSECLAYARARRMVGVWGGHVFGSEVAS